MLARNPDFYGPAPGFEEIQIYPIEDEKAAEIAFEAGELDYTAISVSSIPELQASPPAGVNLVEKAVAVLRLARHEHRSAAVRRPPGAAGGAARGRRRCGARGRLFRRRRAGDRDHRAGPDRPPRQLWAHPRPDLEGAQALLAEAGQRAASPAPSTSRTRPKRLAAQVIQANLAEIGISGGDQPARHRHLLVARQRGRRRAWRTLQLILQKYGMQPDPAFATAWFTPEQVGVWNWERFDQGVRRAARRALVATDPGPARGECTAKCRPLMDASGRTFSSPTRSTPRSISHDLVPALLPDGACGSPVPAGEVIRGAGPAAFRGCDDEQGRRPGSR